MIAPLPDKPALILAGSGRIYTHGDLGPDPAITLCGVLGTAPPRDGRLAVPARGLGDGLSELDAACRLLTPAGEVGVISSGLVLRVHRSGGTNIVLERFDGEAALVAIEQHRITHSQWAPWMLEQLASLPPSARRRYDLSSHRISFVHGVCAEPIVEVLAGWWGARLLDRSSD